jgi:DNA-binding transcriptional LysR family regulator
LGLGDPPVPDGAFRPVAVDPDELRAVRDGAGLPPSAVTSWPRLARLVGGPGVLGHVLPHLARYRPDIVWLAETRSAADAVRAVREGGCDLAILVRWPHTPPLDCDGLVRDVVHQAPLRLLLSARSQACAPLGLGALARWPWVLRTDPDARRAVLMECGRAGFVPDVRLSVDDPATIASVVDATTGVALEPVPRTPQPGLVSIDYPGAAEFRYLAIRRDRSIVADVVDDLRALLADDYA